MSFSSVATASRPVIAAGALIVALAFTGCASQPGPSASPTASTPSPSPTASSPPTTPTPTPTSTLGPEGACDPTQLAVTVEPRPMDSGMSHFYWNLVFTNSSGRNCSLEGNPTVQLGSTSGAAVGNPGEPQFTEGPGAVALPPGASAYSLLSFTQAGAYGCPIVPVDSLLITLPHGEAVAFQVATPNQIDGCDDTVHAILTVGSLTPQPFSP
jgi:hypothetical protein